MVGSNKILTVSYGTFSCTLEGFDDSFGTMRAIAEYFRTLAAEDRFFGAEPPTPDADMLQHFVEKEVRRRVEAKVSDQGIVLRAAEGETPATVAAQGPETRAAAAPEESPAPDVDAVEPRAEAVEAPICAATGQLDTDSGDDAETPVEAADTAVTPPDVAELEREVSPPVLESPPIVEDEDEDEGSFDPIRDGRVDEAPSDSIAAKLSRIRSVVSKSVQEDAVAQELSAGTWSEVPDVSGTTEILSEVIPAPGAMNEAEAAPEAGEDDTPPVDESLAAGSDMIEADVDAGDTPESEPGSVSAEPAEGPSSPEAPVPEEMDDLPTETTAEEGDDPENSADAEPIPAALRPDGRGVRVKKTSLIASLQAALAGSSAREDGEKAVESTGRSEPAEAGAARPVSAETEADADQASAAAAVQDDMLAGLSAEDEAELLRELDLAERELAAGAVDTAPEAQGQRLATDVDTPVDEDESTAEPSAPAFGRQAAAAGPSQDAEPEGPAEKDLIPEDPALVEDMGPAETKAPDAAGSNEQADAAKPARVTPETAEDDLIDAVIGIVQESQMEARTETAAARRALILGANGEADPHVTRLLDETNSKLAGPEMQRRRSAIEHLKAAVAATRAEGTSLREVHDGDRLYRDDLREAVKEPSAQPERKALAAVPNEPPEGDVPTDESWKAEATTSGDAGKSGSEEEIVRPRRPVLGERRERAARPEGTMADAPRVAPLMLVSEQRVDEPEGNDAARTVRTVRPRRVATGRISDETIAADNSLDGTSTSRQSMVSSDVEAAGIFAESTTFDEFSNRMGATGLEELLECAAAYMSYVQGQPHFSHPDIMDVVRQVEGQGELRREDSLRSFGQLLRQGTFRKLDRGQFALTQSSRYVPEERNAAL